MRLPVLVLSLGVLVLALPHGTKDDKWEEKHAVQKMMQKSSPKHTYGTDKNRVDEALAQLTASIAKDGEFTLSTARKRGLTSVAPSRPNPVVLALHATLTRGSLRQCR